MVCVSWYDRLHYSRLTWSFRCGPQMAMDENMGCVPVLLPPWAWIHI